MAIGLPPKSSKIREVCTRHDNLIPLAVHQRYRVDLTFHEHLPLQSFSRPEIFPAYFAGSSLASLESPERVPSLYPIRTDSRARRLSEFPLSLFTTSAESVYLSRGDPTPRYVPSLAFHPPSTVFSAPEPRGLVSSHSRVQGSPFRGLTSSVEQYRVILGQCPLAVRDATPRPKPLRLAFRLRLWSKPRRKSRSRLQGFALYTGYDGDHLAVKPGSSSCPSWVFTPPGSGFRTVEDAFTSHPLATLSEATRSVLILSVLPVLNLYRLEFVDHPARVF